MLLLLFFFVSLITAVSADFFLQVKFDEELEREELANILRLYLCIGKGYPKKCAILHQIGTVWQPGGTASAVWDDETPQGSAHLIVGMVTKSPKNAWKKVGLHKIHHEEWSGPCKLVLSRSEDEDGKLRTKFVC